MSFEYASVSASAYDVNSLVGKLNEKAADGWDVVSIVPTGGDVTAFLKREASAASDGGSALADTSEAAGTSDSGESAAAAAYGAGTAAAVSEPAGWAAEPTTTSADDGGALPSSTETSWSAGSAAVEEEATATTEPEPVSEAPSTYAGTGSSEPSYSGAAGSEPASTTAAAAPAAATTSVPTTPAGWYPDPSGRYEMRYWDGDKWTEHVSRQGQTFTDPPVA